MERYAIYCTAEQTKKALELGAPIHALYIEGNHELWEYKIPTAEQMVGWMEEQELIDSIEITKSTIVNEQGEWQYSVWDKEEQWDCGAHGFNSRKEATLAAIDATLNDLSNSAR